MHIKTRIGGAFTPLEGPGHALPELEAEVDDPACPYMLRLQITVVHGKPVCTSLTAERRPDGIPVTRRGLNGLRLDPLVRLIAANAALKVTAGNGWIAYDLVTPQQAGEVLAELAPQRGRRGDPAAKDELMRKVVVMYRRLVNEFGIKQPKPEIARELSISQSYVSALLAEARRRGLLGAAIPGRAGEAAQ